MDDLFLQNIYNLDSFLLNVQVCYQDLILPNVFSPNGDGVNDFFKAGQTFAYDKFDIVIFNRWGNKVFESINPFFVVTLTPLVVMFFGFLRRRKKEPTTATKIAYGLLISALSTLVMVLSVHYSDNGIHKASAMWLIGSYGVITIGELFLSPMGLSMVSKLSPLRFTALMMGGWSLATAIGNKLSGVLAKNWDKFDDPQEEGEGY